MKLAGIALIAAAFSGVRADCKTDDSAASWPLNVEYLEELVARLCMYRLGGGFDKGDIKFACEPIAGKTKLERMTWAIFQVTYNGDDPYGRVSPAECSTMLTREVTGCEHGGHTSLRGWEYRAMPQHTDCSNEVGGTPS
ncbi:unnamed protein product [Periconia digitata]|uniref:Uncharacterized protein n=1 Tax=Periconia digitata TaxID=1303443 RepID=A0A9W4UHN6_9PLEO|nr:unnamed protein product [Periconia digitata]